MSTDVECAVLAFTAAPFHRNIVNILVDLGKQGKVRTHGLLVFACCIKALNASIDGKPSAFVEAAIFAREGNRLLGRPIPVRAVGSTLLLKGLET